MTERSELLGDFREKGEVELMKRRRDIELHADLFDSTATRKLLTIIVLVTALLYESNVNV